MLLFAVVDLPQRLDTSSEMMVDELEHLGSCLNTVGLVLLGLEHGLVQLLIQVAQRNS